MDINQLVDKNQPIKIVPSVEESLNIIGLNTDIDENIVLWLNQLKLKWKTWKKSPPTDHHFDRLFKLTPDPYRVTLVCIVKCEEFKDCKPKSLPYYIIEGLHNWSQSSDLSPEETLKLPAYQIAIQQRSLQFLKLLMKTYQVYTIKETILPKVKNMIKNDNCKQAAQIVIALELFDEIPVEDLLFPLILQDKSNMIDEYLSECPNQVRRLLLFLDNLLNKNFNIRDYAQRYVDEHKVCNVKYEKIHFKPLGKLVARLCNKFNIPLESCQNLSKNRTRGGLRYLIHQKYIEHNVSSSVWDDLVKDSLRNNVEGACEFIDMVVEHDVKEALKWATYFNIPEVNLPLALRNMSIEEVPEENWDDVKSTNLTKYYKLPLLENNIKIIDTGEKFYDLVSNLINCSVISIDCEWKPSFGATQSQVALIQIASYNSVYLIDTLILNNKHYSSFWYRFNKSVLDNAEIIKLGFGLEQDLKEIKTSINGLSNVKIKGEGLLDLGILWKSLVGFGLSLPSDSDNGGNSLSSLVQACFGLPLEKAEQCSNWELRPLRSTQVYYAALDAFVLLEVYYYLQKLCVEQQINFDEICNDVMLEKKLKSSKKITVADRLLACTVVNFKPKPIKDVKIVVEHDLSHLLAYFRYCGIDSIVVSKKHLWHDTVNVALLEDRIVLTAKLKCSPTPRFSQNLILDVSQGSVKDQVQKTFSNYNIIVTQSDLLSRCLHCNLTDLRKLSSDEVIDICNKYQLPSQSNTNIRRYVSDNEEEDSYYDNFLSDSDGDDLYLYQTVTPQNKSCVTNKGAIIDISNHEKLLSSPKPAILCESCGKLFWDEDPLMISVCEIVSSIINLSD